MKVLVTGHDGYIGSGSSTRSSRQQATRSLVSTAGCFAIAALGRAAAQFPLSTSISRGGGRCTSRVSMPSSIWPASRTTLWATSTRSCTYDINHLASVRLASLAKQAGISRFLFSSSCSLYGSGGEDYVDEKADFNPVTPYGESKILVEQDVSLSGR